MNDLGESNSQLIGAWSYFANRVSGGVVEELGGVTAAFCRVPIAFFNIAFLVEPVSGPEEWEDRLRRACVWCERQNVPWLFCCAESAGQAVPGALERALERAGLAPMMPLTGMIADELLPPARRLPELEYHLARDPQTTRWMGLLNQQAYGMPADSGLEGDFNDAVFGPDAYGVVGWHDGAPVSCTATILVAGRLYVAYVATPPQHQRRGYAEAVMRRSLEEAARERGWRRSVLHATDAGRPVYARMGYRAVERYMLYSRADSAAH